MNWILKMKKRILLLAAFFVMGISGLKAQYDHNRHIVRDNFEQNRFQWEEFYSKDATGYIDAEDGVYVLQNKKKYPPFAKSVTDLPLIPQENFKYKVTFIVPKLNKSCYFGIVWGDKDYTEEVRKNANRKEAEKIESSRGFGAFMVSEGKYKVCGGSELIVTYMKAPLAFLRVVDEGRVVLRSGQNKEVVLEMEKKGNKLIFSVDNMEVVTLQEDVMSRSFGFIVEGKNTIKVKEAQIEQLREED